MFKQQLMDQLDSTRDFNERLIGADWLEENNYSLEAGFYRWLVAMALQPFCSDETAPHADYRWFHPLSVCDGKRKQAILPLSDIWNSLRCYRFLSGFDFEGILICSFSFPSYAEAVTALRNAYIINYEQKQRPSTAG